MSDYPIGSTAEVFYDSDGNPCTLRQLVVSEPDWAVSRINHERREARQLTAKLAAAEAEIARERAIPDDFKPALHSKRYIEQLEAKLAATQQRMAECERDAGRYRLVRDHIVPHHLVQSDFPDFGDIPDSESISERIDRMVDAVIDEAMGRG